MAYRENSGKDLIFLSSFLTKKWDKFNERTHFILELED